MLAHYHELDYARSCGIDSHLVRVSVGLEDYDVLERVFLTALDSIPTS